MRGRWMAMCFALVVTMSGEAKAFNNCNEACLYLAYGLVTVGGLSTAVVSQVQILQGEPSQEMGYVTLGLAAANGAVGAGLLIGAAIAAASDDDDLALGLGIWGGVQMSIAVSGLFTGATAVANDDPPPGEKLRPLPAGASFSFEF